MKTCPICAEEIEDRADHCTRCAAELASQPSPEDQEIGDDTEVTPISGPASSGVWGIAGGLVILAAAVGAAASFHFHQQAQQARQREILALEETARLREIAEPTLGTSRGEAEARSDVPALANAEAQSTEPTDREVPPRGGSDLPEPHLLYKSTLAVPASSFREVLIGNAENYGEILGRFASAKAQAITVLALSEDEFFRYRAGAKVEGRQWTGVADEFSFTPEADSCFLVVQQKSASMPANVSLEVYGRPRLEASREVPRPSAP